MNVNEYLSHVLTNTRTTQLATCDTADENREIRRCSRLEYVKNTIENCTDIEVMTFDAFLTILGTMEAELASVELADIEYLKDRQYARHKDIGSAS